MPFCMAAALPLVVQANTIGDMTAGQEESAFQRLEWGRRDVSR